MSRSKKRKRPLMIHARVTAAEHAEVTALAKAAGGISSLFRIAVLGHKPPKSKIDQQAVVKVLSDISRIQAEAGKQGSNLNQLTHILNAGRPPERVMGLLEDCLANVRMVQTDMLEIRGHCMRALGLEPNRKLND